MKPWVTLAEARTSGGGAMVLQRRDTEYAIRVDGQVLMSSRAHDSERALAALAVEHTRSLPAPRVLIGGLGLGFTLRAALDGLPAAASITVCELLPEISEWNRTHLRELSGDALGDPRVTLRIGDVRTAIRRSSALDAILLDVDNGPSALTQPENRGLYAAEALEEARRALSPGGVYVVWSAGPDEAFASRMRKAGFTVRVQPAPSRGARHVLFTGVSGARA